MTTPPTPPGGQPPGPNLDQSRQALAEILSLQRDYASEAAKAAKSVFNSNIHYITENFNQNIANNNKIKYEIPKNIYIYWDNLKNNDIIQYFINNIKRKASLNNWKVYFITRENVHQYVDKQFYKKFINLNSVRFSDFL